jgi:hypothetical protein
MSDIVETTEAEKAELKAKITAEEKKEADAELERIEKEELSNSFTPEFLVWLETFYKKVGKIELTDNMKALLETAWLSGQNASYQKGYNDGYERGYDQATENAAVPEHTGG